MTTLQVKNVRAIHDLEIDLPDDSGGVLVLKGRNAAGKSTVLEIIRCLLAGKGKLQARDGTPKGSAEGFGKSVNVGARTTWSGEVEVPSLEGRFDFSDLVAPPGKEPETRDSIRIKALLNLTGAKADPELFYDLVGGKEKFEALVPADQIKKAEDLVELAAKVHKALHAAAKLKESDATHAGDHMRACKEAAGDAKPEESIDLDPLHEASRKVATEHGKLEARRQAAADNATMIEEAEAKMAAEQGKYAGMTIQEAEHEVSNCDTQVTFQENLFEKLKKELANAEGGLTAAKHAKEMALAKHTAAVSHEQLLTELQQQITNAQGGEDPPSPVELTISQKNVDAAKVALEAGIKRRDAVLKAKEALAHKAAMDKAEKEAEALRGAARSVDSILSTQLPEGPLKADAGRLVLDTERGEGVPFDDCSDGERNFVALPYGINSVGAGGYLVLVQSGWQDLDTEHRAGIAKLCETGKVWLITGEVADGELRAEPFKLQEATS